MTERKRMPGINRLSAWISENRWDLLFVLLMGCLLFGLSCILPLNQGPDEGMRYLIPQYVYRHGTIPVGWDPEILDKKWGISYAFQPIIPYLMGGYFMKLVGIFTREEHALLMAARFANILFGMGFYWYVRKISKKLFAGGMYRFFFVALLAMLPQLLYLFTYVNTDGIALFSTAMIIDAWLTGMERKWDRGSCTRLAIGVAVCALSYFNAYGYALFSIVLFLGSMCVHYKAQGAKKCALLILKKGLYITVLVLILAGWWFARSAVLYDGDILGMNASARCAEEHAQSKYKPSNKQSLREQGVSLHEMMVLEEEGGMEWGRTTWRSFIGYFGYFQHPLGLDIYEIHKRIFALGAVGLVLKLLLYLAGFLWVKLPMPGRIRERIADWFFADGDHPDTLWKNSEVLSLPGAKITPIEFLLLQISLVCCIIIPLLLAVYYSYASDFQAQGRYVMPLVIPLMYLTTLGVERFMTIFREKWIRFGLMSLQFYAVAHVFLGAFVSVYIPAYYAPLSGWAGMTFGWFTNLSAVQWLIRMLIPG